MQYIKHSADYQWLTDNFDRFAMELLGSLMS